MSFHKLEHASNDFYDNAYYEIGIYRNLEKALEKAEEELVGKFPPDRLLISRYELEGDEFKVVKTWFKGVEYKGEWQEALVECD